MSVCMYDFLIPAFYFTPTSVPLSPSRSLSPKQLISLADGHITLSPLLMAAGLSPPLDPSHSLTRIGVGSNNGRNVDATVSVCLK